MVSILLNFLYNPKRTNLTYFGINPFSGPSSAYTPLSQQVDCWNNVSGSIDAFINLTNIQYFFISFRRNITGNISIMENWSKIMHITLLFGSTGYFGLYNESPSTNISGSISVFANKYDLQIIRTFAYKNIYGEIKNLKNLKKLVNVDFRYTSITGSKTDFYNNGTGVTQFLI